VDVAVARGAAVLPYRWKEDSARAFAASKGALLAGSRSSEGYSLSPASLQSIPSGAAIVLPSPNGSTLSLAIGASVTFAACLRNCESVAARAAAHGPKIAVIPAGERWQDDTLRPCLEDLIGAGAVLARLPGRRSPEAELAMAAFERFRGDLHGALSGCGSGQELIEMGFASDIEVASKYACSAAAPILIEDRFVNERG
jgi:2-phosphosulfolactate phosphatase